MHCAGQLYGYMCCVVQCTPLSTLAAGDELLLKHGSWEASGYVIRLHEATEEVALELRADRAGRAAPTDVTAGFTVECVWNGTTFERMQRALKQLAVDSKCTAQVVYHKYACGTLLMSWSTLLHQRSFINAVSHIPFRLLGHSLEDPGVKGATFPRSFHAPGLPELNPSQVLAVKAVLKQHLSLIQGPPGTGKTVTSATIVYHLAKSSKAHVGTATGCAPSHTTHRSWSLPPATSPSTSLPSASVERGSRSSEWQHAPGKTSPRQWSRSPSTTRHVIHDGTRGCTVAHDGTR